MFLFSLETYGKALRFICLTIITQVSHKFLDFFKSPFGLDYI